MKKLFTAVVFFLSLAFYAKASDLPRKEYPRPQFERESWINLNGTWTFDFDFGQSGVDRQYQSSEKFSQNITVPFCPESELSGVKHTDFINCMWYQRKISIPSDWQGKKIFLHFGAVDYWCELYIDGKKVQQHWGGSSSFTVDITRFVKAGNTHNLVIQVRMICEEANRPAENNAPTSSLVVVRIHASQVSGRRSGWKLLPMRV